MTNITMLNKFSKLIQNKYDIYDFRHAVSIFKNDFTDEFNQLSHLLEVFQIANEDILTGGGGKSPITSKIEKAFHSNGWIEKKWKISVHIDDKQKTADTHKVDSFKNKVAVEFEWNNKDTFYDRDLNNFAKLHQLGVISLGIIVTRADELQELFNKLGKGKSYGASTTHVGKLLPKIKNGGGAECPLLIFAINKNTVNIPVKTH